MNPLALESRGGGGGDDFWSTASCV